MTSPLSSDNDALLKLIESDHVDEVCQLLERVPESAFQSGRREETPLHRACALGREQIVKILLAKGAPIESVSRMLHTPLEEAVTYEQETIVQLLLDAGADPGKRSLTDDCTILATPKLGQPRADSIFVKLLLAGAEFDLYLAVAYGQIQMTSAFLQYLGDTALQYPYSNQLLEIACGLYPGGCFELAGDKYIYNATVHPRLQQRRHAMVSVLLKHGFSPNKWKYYPPLFRAAQKDDADCVTELLNHGADPHVVVHGESLDTVAQRWNAQRALSILRQFSGGTEK
jgi:ankyrin repeat protein